MKRNFFIIINLLAFVLEVNGQQIENGGFELSKKTKYTGILMSYTGTQKDNVASTFENVIYSKDNSTSVKIGGGYFIRNNFAVGIGFNIGFDNVDKELKNTLGPNTSTNLNSNTFGFSPFVRNYLSLGSKKRFFLFNQTGITFSKSKGDETSTNGNNIVESSISKNALGISISPGVLIFVEDGFAFEVNIPIGGVNYSKETKSSTNLPDAVIKQANVDLNINILRMNLGFSYYF